MAVDVRVISFSIGLGAVGSTVVITPGFLTSALYTVWNGRTDAANAGGGATSLRGYGLSTGAGANVAVGARDADAAGTANTDCTNRTDGCIVEMGDGAVAGIAKVQSVSATQVTFEIVDQFTTNLRVMAFCFSGLDNAEIVTITPGGAGAATVTYNNVGNFPPNAALFIGTVLTSDNAVGVDSSLTFGAAVLSDVSATIENAVHWSGSNNGSTNMVTGSYCRAGDCFANNTLSPTTAPGNRGSVSAFNASPGGLDIAWDARANSLLRIHCLMMKGGVWNITGFPTSTSTGQGSLTGMPTTPVGLIFVSACCPEHTAGAVPSLGDEWSVGLADPTDQFCVQASSRNGNTTSFVYTAYRTDKIYVNVNTTSDTVEGEIALVSRNADGYTIDQTDADPAANFVWALRVGNPPAGGVTLAADPGAFTITGTAAGLRLGRKVQAAPGAFAWSGSAATLRLGRKVVATSGAYAVAGSAAALRRTARLTAASGGVTWAGTPASLERGLRLSASPGSYSWAGIAADLSRSKRMEAAAGSVVWSGSAVLFDVGRALTAEAGGYAVLGSDAFLRLSRRLVAGSGAVVWTGQDATLVIRVGYTLPADAGSYLVGGTAAALRRTARMPAGSGTFQSIGSAATLRATRRLLAAGGQFNWTGQPAIVGHARSIESESGGFVWAGAPANLRLNRGLVAEPGVFLWIGTAATLQYGEQIVDILKLSGSLSPIVRLTGSLRDVLEFSATLVPTLKLAGSTGEIVQLSSSLE